MNAVAVRGFQMLGARIAAAQEAAAPAARFRSIGESYLGFAIDEPHLFRLMFRGEVIDVADPDLRAASEPLLGDTASGTGAEGRLAQDRTILAWAIVHGLATLALDSQLDNHISADPTERRDTLLRLIGLTAPLFSQDPPTTPT